MTPPELFMPCPFLKLKFFANVLDPLFPLTCLCILSLYVVSDLCDVPVFHVITKILHLLFTPLFLVSPFLVIYNHSTLFSKWMKEWSENNVIKMIKICQNLVITHIIYISPLMLITPPRIYLPLYKISPPFWHWCQWVLRSNTMFGQKCIVNLKECL